MQKPPVPSGSDAGTGPWLLVTKDTCNFGSMGFGATGGEVVEKLKSYGEGTITASPTPLHQHPFSIRATHATGCAFGFDADKKLTLIGVTGPARAKLPGGLVLGESTPADFAKIFGTASRSDLAIPCAGSAQKCQLGWGKLHWWDSRTSTGKTTGIAVQKN